MAYDTPQMVAIGDYLANLTEGLATLGCGPNVPRIAVHHGGESVAADVAVRLGSVVNELVINSMKYAYDDNAGGEIRVAFSVLDGSFVLIVADDGRGIGAPPVARCGRGRRLVESIAVQLEARFSYQPARPGTIAILSGPAEALSSRCGGAAQSRGASHAPGPSGDAAPASPGDRASVTARDPSPCATDRWTSANDGGRQITRRNALQTAVPGG
ncbi:hypothetical protein FHS95_002362 [Sphingomonas naasensis]|nr:sensor histidine kinase [Sphingomonas naasensis]NIJ20670.1 hypothetical protein [Sphingomonas naasensis]